MVFLAKYEFIMYFLDFTEFCFSLVNNLPEFFLLMYLELLSG